MKLNLVFDVDSIVRIDASSIEVYPNLGAEVSFGLGFQSTGRYVVNEKNIKGDLVYNRTNTFLDKMGRLYSIGNLIINIKHEGDDIILSSTFKVRTIDPKIPFSQDKIIALVTSASINNKIKTGHIQMKPINGGKQWKTKIILN
jgi:hypothetical protein